MFGSTEKSKKVFYYKKCGFTLYQQNGQRTYGGPPPNWGSRPPPSRDCEVFIGRLPRMCFEDELIPLFLSVGELYEFRLMLDFSGTNRGYGYAHYATLDGAQRAIEKLNKYEIRPGHQIGVLKSKNNCRLLFGNIKVAFNSKEFNKFIHMTTEQVLKVFMFKNFLQLKQSDFRISAEVEEAFLGRMPRNNENNLFAVVEYENHKAAAVARRVLIPKYGHVLAIDWAVPPRERKRLDLVSDSPASTVERPLSNASVKDPNLSLVSKSYSKIRPVPVLLVHPSPLDNVPFMPKHFKTVVKFFKYLLSVCLYESVDQLEIPLYICKEIERKIVDRITNLENCSQAIQLIFNYFSWYNEKKRFIVNSEVQKILQEVKFYADSFVFFINERIGHGPSQNPAEDNYYIHCLPFQLNVLFRITLHSALNAEHQEKLSFDITAGIKWCMEIMQKLGKSPNGFLEEIINAVKTEEDGISLDKASTLAKSRFLNTIIVKQQSQNLGNDVITGLPMQKYFHCKSNENDEKMGMNVSSLDENQKSISLNTVLSSLQKTSPDIYRQYFKVDAGHYIPMPFSQIGKLKEEVTEDLIVYQPVPLLLVQPSIFNKIPFMPDIFNNVLTYFKHLIRIYVNVNAWHMNIPHQISAEIGRKIISRISNVENCSEGVQLILDYFSSLAEKKQCSGNLEVLKLLQEVKKYADSFVNFVWSKTVSVYIPDEAVENYFCKVLPLRLNILFHMMLIFSNENPVRSLVGITKGLEWLEKLIQKDDITAKQFLEELTRFIVELNPISYEKAKNLGKVFCAELMNCNDQPIVHEEMLFPIAENDDLTTDKGYSNSSSNAEVSSNISIIGSDNASEGASDGEFYLL